MRLVCLSDSHGLHRQVQVPDGDVLIHCGDFTGFGTLKEVILFNAWLGTLPHKHKIVIAGNHDSVMEVNRDVAKSALTNCQYLENGMTTIKGIKFWGSPYTPLFMNWSFMRERGKGMNAIWNKMPEEVDVIITHGPPMGILDETLLGKNVGCEDLLYHVGIRKPKIHCFGHIHGGYGGYESEDKRLVGIKFINCSVANESYNIVNEPIVVDI